MVLSSEASIKSAPRLTSPTLSRPVAPGQSQRSNRSSGEIRFSGVEVVEGGDSISGSGSGIGSGIDQLTSEAKEPNLLSKYKKREGIDPPNYSVSEHFKLMTDIFSNQDFDRRISLRNKFKLLMSSAKIGFELLNIYQYLPKVTKKRVKRYLFSIQIFRDFFNKEEPGIHWRKLMSYAGAPICKMAQDIAQQMAGFSLSDMKGEEEKLTTQLTELKKEPVSAEQKQKLKETKEELASIKRAIWQKQVFGPMLSRVPEVAYKAMEADVKETVNSFNQAYPDHKILKVNKTPVGTGSIAQCYEAELAKPLDGKDKIILKVFRSEVNPEYMQEYDNMLYRLNLVLLGATDKTYPMADMLAQNQVQVLRNEIHPTREKKLADNLVADIKREGMDQSIFVPQVYATGKRGMAIEFAEGDNLEDLSTEDQQWVINQKASDLLKLSILIPSLHLDPHSGNIRVKLSKNPAGERVLDKFSLIDFGRGTLLNPEAHQAFLELQKGIYTLNGFPDDEKLESVFNPVLGKLFKNPEQIKTITDINRDLYQAVRSGFTVHPLMLEMLKLQDKKPVENENRLLAQGLVGTDIVKGYSSLVSLMNQVNFHEAKLNKSDEVLIQEIEALEAQGVDELNGDFRAAGDKVFSHDGLYDDSSETFKTIREQLFTLTTYSKTLDPSEAKEVATLREGLFKLLRSDFPEKERIFKVYRTEKQMKQLVDSLTEAVAKKVGFASKDEKDRYQSQISEVLWEMCYGFSPLTHILDGERRWGSPTIHYNRIGQALQEAFQGKSEDDE